MFNSQKDFYKKLYGKISEKKALAYLKKKGFKLLEKNFSTKFGEADIIMQDDKTIVFVEVKARNSQDYGTPGQAVNFKKQQKYEKIANYFLFKNNFQDVDVRFDVVEVEKDEINHIINAFTC